jgi:hypothetical protein
MESKEAETKKKRTVLSTLARIFLWILSSVIFLIIVVLILIQTSFVQNFARKKVVTYLEHKLKTTVAIGKLNVDFPTALSLQNVFIEDQSKDTLLYGGEIKVNIDMIKLLRNDIEIKEIALNNMLVEVKRLPPDSVFNFQFIVDAFASEQKKVPEKQDTATLKMNIDHIVVNKTRVIYRDVFTGNDMDLAFGHLDTKISTFDPAHLLFNVPSVTLNGLKGYFYQNEPLKQSIKKTVSEASAHPENYLQLINKEMNLSNIDVVFKSQPAQINSSFVIKNAQIHPKTIDLKNSIITLKDASMDNSDIAVETATRVPDKKPNDTLITVPPTPPLKIITGAITLQNINVKYDDSSAPKVPSGMDYMHLGIQDLSLNAENVQYSLDTILATVKSASMKEKSGFVLDNLITNLVYEPHGVFLSDLLLQTPGSEIKNRAYITYQSLDAIKKNPGELHLFLDLQNSKINMKDLWTFVPQIKPQTSLLSSNSTLYVDAKVTGKVNDLNLQKVILRGLTSTDINVTGVLKGMPDAKKIYADLTINKFQTSRRDILSLLPKNTLPSNISLPIALDAGGVVKGDMNNLYTDLTVNSTSGGAQIKGTLKNITDKNKASYDVAIKTTNLQLGSLMQNAQLGVLTATVNAKGHGYDPQTANATFDGLIPTVRVNNYTYHNIKAQGSIAQKNYQITASLHDPNLSANIKASGIFAAKYPSLDLNATVDSIKTQSLHFTTQPLIYHGRIAAHFTSLDPDHLNGTLNVTHSILVNNGDRITMDSVAVIAQSSTGNQSLTLKTDFLTASVNGQYKLTQMADVFRQLIDPFFSLGKTKNTAKVDPYHFTITASVINNAALQAFMPEITQLQPIAFRGTFATDSNWRVYLKSPHVVYGNIVIDSLIFDATTRNNALVFNTSLQQLKSPTSLGLYETTLNGSLKNNAVDFTLNIKDQKSKNKYTLSGNLNQPSLNKYIFSLKPDSLLLNYEKWTVNAGNKIEYSNNDINVQNFILSQGNQQLSINSAGPGTNEPLKINFRDFKIETLTGFIQNDTLMLSGLLNGNALVKNIQTQPAFVSDLTVNDLSIYKDTIGDLSAKVNNNIANTYHADVNLTGRGNNIKINGDYKMDPLNSSYNFLVDLVSFQMKSLEGFSKGAIKDARGNLYGKIALNGTLKSPNIDGKIHFNNTAFNAAKVNNVFKVDKEAVAIINNEGIIFNTFTIRDTSNNAIVIDGALNTTNFFDYEFNLKITAKNFQAINSTKKDNNLFYGKMIFSTNMTVKGTPTHPVVDGDLTINDKTDFTVVLPQNEPGVEKREGVVRFVDRSATAEDSLFMKPYDSLKIAPLQGYDVSLNINVNKDAIFNMIVDAGNGDFLRLKGTGQMTGGIDASGKITLVGSYEIEEGTYNLSFNFLKRKFDIEKGSRIVWTGEPTTAQINVTGIYVANTAPIDLVQGQIEESKGNENIYKQKLPFEVHLLLQGELLKPQITFDVILPKDKNYNVSDAVISTVQTKLTQMRNEPSEMNKQVFALLLLNRFVGEDPFSSSGGSMNAGTFAMQSVSRLLSEQLNQLASNLVQGVDINFDLATTQDYTTGSEQNRTDLNVGISKRLLSDRLTVSVGSDFELQGPMQSNQSQNNLAGNISINYKLSKDGKYMLRAYRKNDYTGEIEGYVIETGIGFIISVDYNRFRQIFMSKNQKEKKREIRKQNREIKKEDNTRKIQDKTIAPPSKAKENDQ